MSAQFASLPLPFAQFPIARLGSRFGYRFEGDQVELNADIESVNGYNDLMSLQLWACDASGQPDRAIKVGECAADAFNGAWGWSDALPPAGREARTMVLALTANGEVQDSVTLPNAQQFSQPRLAGCSGYRLENGDVEISVEAIENPRESDNVSGDLNVELWALEAPYAGGAFTGTQIAQVNVGRLGGEQRLDNLNWHVAATLPTEGRWYMTLMLREWTANGYVTRDFAAYPQIFDADARDVTAQPAVQTPAPAAKAPATAKAPVAPAAKPEAKPAARKAEPKAEAKQPAAKQPAAKPVAKAEVKARPMQAEAAQVSINTASEAELAAIKGLSKTVAKAIVAGRPYASVDALEGVKGLGKKTLDKLRASLKK
ncbi:ComEA family DNA-binding protein [Nitrogeniibacter aestuarii]|uniref:ComEA family DNA-binding protein n=1 Tax=Nitrogeniibacter aestuarii TaxID=2815343 RepID=UPI001E417C63|nr:helix-hairpin-helix domain-containing protein [Nitrogeniibacter aestuarii]